MRTGQIAAMLLTALALEGCYAQYNYRPSGYTEAWSMGHHDGHLGWYDGHGHWQGWFDGAAWHDAHEATQHGASTPLSDRSAMGSVKSQPALRRPVPTVAQPVLPREEAPSAVNPVPEPAQTPVFTPLPTPTSPSVPSVEVPKASVAAPPVPATIPASRTSAPAKAPTPQAIEPAAPPQPTAAKVPAVQTSPVQPAPQPAQEPAPSIEQPLPVQPSAADEAPASPPTTPQPLFKIKPGTSMPDGPDESTSAASQVLPAWLSPSPDPVPTSQPTPARSSGRAASRTTRKTTP